MRLRRRRVCYICAVLVVLVCFSCGWTFLYFYRNSSIQLLNIKCNIAESNMFIQELCHNYSKRLVTGSLCGPLCSLSDITIHKCLGHKTKDHIILAEWDAESVVLKADADLSTTMRLHFHQLSEEQRASYTLSTEMFLDFATRSLRYNVFGRKENPDIEMLADYILAECSQRDDEVLSFSEALYCFHLTDELEFVLTLALQGVSGIPKLFGVCGNMYAVEYASITSLAGGPLFEINDPRGWEFKVTLAVALIEMVESFEVTNFGILYNCDVQESNFGFVKQSNKVIAKSIDSDFSMLEASLLRTLEFESSNNCSDDMDCDYIDCKIPCNKTSQRCSGHLTSNNLQVICLELFVADTHKLLPHFRRGLLSSPPASIKTKVNELLEECVNPRQPSNHSSLLLAHELKTLLQDSIS